MNYLRVLYFDEEESIEKLEATFIQIWEEQFVQPLSIKNELAVMGAIDMICRGSLQKYPTTLEEDKKRMESEDLTQNERNVLTLIMREKNVMNSIIESAEYVTGMLKLGKA